ncbi:hypothetical protein HKT18_05050 [Flavobacterium sp. IMCC34852]|uniref:Fibrobacter succinogenes major paralogous domain-containing protein n=1 Tax=Flavobacterium rivulicola TaxID=2732161 RepID=A0A7Y3VYN0_9FLAO|nr:fibrobacter succinogenes major paralogous domain-containing protein [Flavobacterium sp. IMCC34852]NNT71581.1 hypothetical protein [Flavobacterium sp. IMCC34852]
MKKMLILTLVTFLVISCSSEDDSSSVNPEDLFRVETSSVNNLGHQSATVFGRFGPTYIAGVSAYGICYGLSPEPTTAGPHTTETNISATSGVFYSNLISLSQNTTYYVRAYATNAEGTFYGEQITLTTLGQLFTNAGSVTDIDGNTYPSIIINNKQWMKENLNVSKYRNGDVIPEVTDPTQWEDLTTGAWCYYANETANGTTYGKLYNWYAVNDPRGLAPAGWHVATDQEWTALTTFLGGNTTVAGAKLRDTGALWAPESAIATNQSGFSALPSGRSFITVTPTGEDPFMFMGKVAYWWSSTQASSTSSYTLNVGFTNSITRSSIRFNAGLAVRCVKN